MAGFVVGSSLSYVGEAQIGAADDEAPVPSPTDQQAIQGTSAIGRQSRAFSRAAIAAGLLLHLASFADGPLLPQESTWTQEVVGVRAWRGLKTWPASLGVAAGHDLALSNQESPWTQPVQGVTALARATGVVTRTAARSQPWRTTAVDLVVDEPATWTQSIPGVTLLAQANRAVARSAARSQAWRTHSGEFPVLEPETWTQPTSGTTAIAAAVRAVARAVSASRRVIWTLPEEEGPVATQESTWTVEIAVGVRAWQGLKTWPAGPNVAAGQDTPPNQESTWTAPIAGTSVLRARDRQRWASGARSVSLRAAAAWDPVAGPVEESTWTQRTPGTSSIAAAARTFAARARTSTSYLRAAEHDLDAFDASAGWQSPVFHPAQYQNLIWLLWYGAAGAAEAPLGPQPDTWPQPTLGTRALSSAIAARVRTAARTIGWRQFGASEQVAAPEEPTWTQPVQGSAALRSGAAARTRALAASVRQVWTTAQDADGPLAAQESTWPRPVTGTRALVASTRLAWRVAATQGLRGYGAYDPVQAPPEESTWTQPTPGTSSLRVLAARALARAGVASALLRETAQDVDGPAPTQESTWIHPVPGTRSLAAAARASWRAAVAQAGRWLGSADPIAGVEESGGSTQPTSGTRQLESRQRAARLTAAVTIGLRTVGADDAAAESPAPAQVLRARPSARLNVRAAVTQLWSAASDVEQEPSTPWTQPIVGTSLLRRTTADLTRRSALFTRHGWIVPEYEHGPLPLQPDTWVSPIAGTRSVRTAVLALWRAAARFIAWGSQEDRVDRTPAIDRVASSEPTIDRVGEYRPTIARVGRAPEE